MTNPELPHADAAEFFRWALRRRRRFRVVGESMLPTLTPGEVVFANPRATPRAGDVVCTAHPHDPNTIVIKRVNFIEDDGSLFLRSDNSNASGASDSHRFGLVDPSAAVAVVTSVVRK